MKKLIIAAMVLGMASMAQADLLLGWSFSGTAPIASQVANDAIGANLDTGGIYNDLTRGAGAATSSGNSSFRTTGFQNNGISVANSDYFQFIISAASGYQLSLSDVTANAYGGTAGFYTSPGVTEQWAYSTDGSSFTLIGSSQQTVGTASRVFDFSGTAALQNVGAGTDVYLRYYASGQTSTGGWGFGSAGIDVNGTVTAIPEPGVLALLAIGGIAILRVVRRKA